ncbi:MAG TPA: hypothetical protein PKW66_15590 [Polyangiaceae bacterium]|nr:hypothetical protein [Polyangiaceae bacterium]
MSVLRCPPGRVIVMVGEGEYATAVDIAPASSQSFRKAGELGASPIGQYADWSAEPEARRHAFDALTSCLEQAPTLDRVPALSTQKKARWPWLLLAAGAVFSFRLLLGRKRGPGRMRLRRQPWRACVRDACVGRGPSAWLAFGLLTFVTWSLRTLWMPPRFFHQNGQGPLWIEMALTGGESAYGPGFAEVFGWLTHLSPTAPDKMVFLAMNAVCAFIPLLVWVVARCSGGDVRSCWVLAACTSLHPLLARLARGESYLAVQQALLFAAAAVLAWAGRKRRSPAAFLLAVMSSGLLLSQAVRIHPTSWVPTMVVPFVLLIQPLPIIKRIKRTAVAFTAIAAVLLCTSFSTLWDVYSGPLGQQWPAQTMLTTPRLALGNGALVAALVVIILVGRLRIHSLLVAGTAGVSILLLASADLLVRDVPWIADAYRLQILPVFAAVGVASCRILISPTMRASRILNPLLLLLIAGAFTAGRWKSYRTIPTDALEQSWAMQWRQTLPAGATVAYLKRAENRVFMLPLFPDGPVNIEGYDSRQMALASPLQPGMFYYRSSLCSTAEGAPACAALERDVLLETIEENEFPAIASQPWAPFHQSSLRASLHRVRKAGRSPTGS